MFSRYTDNGQLFNRYTDNAGYYDLCLYIYQIADHRNSQQIKQTWQWLIDTEHQSAVAEGQAPWERVAEKVREVGKRLRLSETTFPVQTLIPLLERYSVQDESTLGAKNWVVMIFFDLEIPYERIFDTFEAAFYTGEQPFVGAGRRPIAVDLVPTIGNWFAQTSQGGGVLFDSEPGARRVEQMIETLIRSDQQIKMEPDDVAWLRETWARCTQRMH